MCMKCKYYEIVYAHNIIIYSLTLSKISGCPKCYLVNHFKKNVFRWRLKLAVSVVTAGSTDLKAATEKARWLTALIVRGMVSYTGAHAYVRLREGHYCDRSSHMYFIAQRLRSALLTRTRSLR